MNSNAQHQIDLELQQSREKAQMAYELTLSRKVAELKQTVKEKDQQIEQLNIALIALVVAFVSFLVGFALYSVIT